MQRLYFVQWLRVFLIALVVAHHAGQAYGPTGGGWPIHDKAQAAWLGPFFGLNAAFFMGFFFLISGYFTGPSHDRKGGGAFARDRLIRLGIPLVVFTFLVFGPLVYSRTDTQQNFLAWYFGTYIGRWQIEMGHLWFVAQLLAYSLLYALYRMFVRQSSASRPAPRDGAILIFALALGIVGALVRTVYPQDRWVDILWIVPAEPAHLPQYVSLFVIGIVAGYSGWFTSVKSGVGARWFVVGVIAFFIGGFAFAMEDDLPAWLPFQMVWGFTEAFVCVGMILGLTVFFRRFCAQPGRWLERLDGNVYGVYLIHWFLVIIIQAAVLNLALPATVKFLTVTAVGLVASFAITALARQIPAVRRVV
jgi:peptidoglycan/LPS O-acetylase OafA/YrhL